MGFYNILVVIQFHFRSPKSTVHIPLPNDRAKRDHGYLFTFKTVVNGIDSVKNNTGRSIKLP